jgi:hypothetical protein
MSECELYLLAERKLAAAARDSASGLVPSAERTPGMLERLTRGLDYERVDAPVLKKEEARSCPR